MNFLPVRPGILGLMLASALACPPFESKAQAYAVVQRNEQQALPEAPTVQVRAMTDVLTELRNHYKVDILFSEKAVQGVSVQEGSIDYNKGLEYNLKSLLSASGLEYRKVKKGSYVVTKVGRNAGSTSASSPASANVSEQGDKVEEGQARPADGTITGKVVDGKGQPIPGVTVLIKGTLIGTSTGPDGTYTLEVPDGAVLEFRSVGFETKEVAVAPGSTTVDAILLEDMKQMEEVVVVGYGTQRRGELTNAVSSVGGEAIARQAVGGRCSGYGTVGCTWRGYQHPHPG